MYKSKEHITNFWKSALRNLSSQQELLYASNRYAVLLIFQAIDAAGKDGTDRPRAPRHSPQRRDPRTRHTTTRRSGTTGIVRSRIWKDTFTRTELASSSSFSTSRRKNSESAFWRASTNRKRTGSLSKTRSLPATPRRSSAHCRPATCAAMPLHWHRYCRLRRSVHRCILTGNVSLDSRQCCRRTRVIGLQKPVISRALNCPIR